MRADLREPHYIVALWTRYQEPVYGYNCRNLGSHVIYAWAFIDCTQRVVCRLKGSTGLSQAFESNMGVKQGCPLSPTLFGLCIDKLKEVLLKATLEEETVHPRIGKYVILLLLFCTYPRAYATIYGDIGQILPRK